MLSTPVTSIPIVACVCCKCTACKCCSKSKKTNICCSRSIHELKVAEKIERVKVRQSSSDEDDTYHVRGERHIPKKVNKPMQKFPKTTLRKTCSEASTSQYHRHLFAESDVSGLYSYVCSLPVHVKPVELEQENLEYIDADDDDPSCFSNDRSMKRGFKQLKTTETTIRNANEKPTTEESSVTSEHHRTTSFFQKLFRPSSSRTSFPAEVRSKHEKATKRFFESRKRSADEKREMSLPVSSKTVKFEDDSARRGQSAAESASIQARTTYVAKAETSSAALDQATSDLLNLTQYYPTISYSSSARLNPSADRIQKSASTSSINKVIRTKDGGLFKLANVFTCDARRLDDSRFSNVSPADRIQSNVIERKRYRNEDEFHKEYIESPPTVETTVEGKMQMEKVVGAKLAKEHEHYDSGWIVRDKTVHYKVRTMQGTRSVVMEEGLPSSRSKEGTNVKVSIYENGNLRTEQSAEVQLPPNVDKPFYLSALGEKLLQDIEALDREDKTAAKHVKTRVEVDVIEDITRIAKTYIIGERAKIPENQLEQATLNNKEDVSRTYAYEESADKMPLMLETYKSETNYLDSLERRETKREDNLITAPSEEKIQQGIEVKLAQRKVPRCAHLFAECELDRKSDSSDVQVTVLIPYTDSFSDEEQSFKEPRRTEMRITVHGKQFSAEDENYSKLKRRIPSESEEEYSEAVSAVSRLTQEGKRYVDEKKHRTIRKFITEESIDYLEKEKQADFELTRLPDSSRFTFTIAIPRVAASITFTLTTEGKKVLKMLKSAVVETVADNKEITKFETTVSSTQVLGHKEERSAAINKDSELVEKTTILDLSNDITLERQGENYSGASTLQRIKRYESTLSEEDQASEKTEESSVTQSTIIDKNDEIVIQQKAESTASVPVSLSTTTNVHLSRKESYGSYDVRILIPNSLESIRLKVLVTEIASVEITTFICKESTMLNQSIILSSSNDWAERCNAQEIEERSASILVGMKKRTKQEEIDQATMKNLSNLLRVALEKKLKEPIIEDVVVICRLEKDLKSVLNTSKTHKEKIMQKTKFYADAAEIEDLYIKAAIVSSSVAQGSSSFVKEVANLSNVTFHCQEATTEQTSNLIYIENELSETVSAPEIILKESRRSKGYKLQTKKSSEEVYDRELAIANHQKQSLEIDKHFRTIRKETTFFETVSSQTEQKNVILSFNRVSETENFTTELKGSTLEDNLINISEFGDETESVSVMMRKAGAIQDQISKEWPEPVKVETTRKMDKEVFEELFGRLDTAIFAESENTSQARVTCENQSDISKCKFDERMQKKFNEVEKSKEVYEKETEHFQNISAIEGSYNKEEKTNLREVRVAMLMAGMDLDTTLLVTPENISLEDEERLFEAGYSSDTLPSLDYDSDDYSEITFHICKRRKKLYELSDKDETDSSASVPIPERSLSRTTETDYFNTITAVEEGSDAEEFPKDIRKNLINFQLKNYTNKDTVTISEEKKSQLTINQQEKKFVDGIKEEQLDCLTNKFRETETAFGSFSEREQRILYDREKKFIPSPVEIMARTIIKQESLCSAENIIQERKLDATRHAIWAKEEHCMTREKSFSETLHSKEPKSNETINFTMQKSINEGTVLEKNKVEIVSIASAELQRQTTEQFSSHENLLSVDEKLLVSDQIEIAGGGKTSDFKVHVNEANLKTDKLIDLNLEFNKTSAEKEATKKLLQPLNTRGFTQNVEELQKGLISRIACSPKKEVFLESQQISEANFSKDFTQQKKESESALQKRDAITLVDSSSLHRNSQYITDTNVYESTSWLQTKRKQASDQITYVPIEKKSYEATELASSEIGAVTARRRFADFRYSASITEKQHENTTNHQNESETKSSVYASHIETQQDVGNIVKGNLSLEKDRIIELADKIFWTNPCKTSASLVVKQMQRNLQKTEIVGVKHEEKISEISVDIPIVEKQEEDVSIVTGLEQGFVWRRTLASDISVPIIETCKETLTTATCKEESRFSELFCKKLMDNEENSYTWKLALREILCFFVEELCYFTAFKRENERAVTGGVAIGKNSAHVMANLVEPQVKECNLHFDRIHLTTPTEKALLVWKMSRYWKEQLSCDATTDFICEKNVTLGKSFEKGNFDCLLRESIKDAHILFAVASKEENLRYTIPQERIAQEAHTVISLVSRNYEKADTRRFKEYELLNALDIFWITILNELDAEVAYNNALTEYAQLKTAATTEVLEVWQNSVERPNEQNEVGTVLREAINLHSEQKFQVSEENIHALADKTMINSEVNRVFTEKQLTTTTGRFNEIEKAEKNATLLFIKRPAKKVSGEAVHVVNLSTTLEQTFQTLSAKTAIRICEAEFAVEYPEYNINEIRSTTIKENACLNTMQTQLTELKESIEFQKKASVEREAKDIFKSLPKQKIVQTLRESENKEYEVLTDWRTIETDLAVESKLTEGCFEKYRLSVIESSEEHIALFQNFEMEEEFEEAECTFKVEVRKACVLKLGIENDFLKIRMEKYPKLERSIKYLHDKRRISVCRKLKEIVLNKIIVTVNIQKLPISKAIQKTDSSWIDHQSVSAIPLRLRCEASEFATAYIERYLRRTLDQCKVEMTLLTATLARPLKFECEQAGNERSDLLIDLHGKPGETNDAGYVWPDSRKQPCFVACFAEYEEEETWLLANVKTQGFDLMNAATCIQIKRVYEPITIATKSAAEESVRIEQNWEIPSLAEAFASTIKIPNRGENVCEKLQESQAQHITAGFHFVHKKQSKMAESTNSEARYGGKYELYGLAMQEMYKVMSMSLEKRNDTNSVRTRWIEKQHLATAINIAASTTQIINIDETFARSEGQKAALLTKRTPRFAEPVLVLLRESSSSTIITNVLYRKESFSENSTGMLSLANYGGHFALETDYAEETVFSGNFLFRANESFDIIRKCLNCPNATIGGVLNTRASQLEANEANIVLFREQESEKATLNYKDSNKADAIRINFTESRYIQQTTYLEFSKKILHAITEFVLQVPIYGGNFEAELDASEENDVNIVRKIKAEKNLYLGCQITILASNWEKPVRLITNASSVVSDSTETNFVQKQNNLAAFKTLTQKILDSAYYEAKESESKEINLFFYFSQDASSESGEKLFTVSRSGGGLSCHIMASNEEETTSNHYLERFRSTNLYATKSFIIANSEAPLYLGTQQTSEIAIVTELWLHRDSEFNETFIDHPTVNKGNNVIWRTSEAAETEEIVTCQYKKVGADMNMQYTVNIPFYGGNIELNTEAARDVATMSLYMLTSGQSRLASTALSVKKSNDLEPCIFVTKASTSEEIILKHLLQRERLKDSTSAIIKDIRKAEIQISFTESTIIDKTTNVHFYKTADTFYDTYCVYLKRFGGSLKMSTKFATEEQTASTISLTALRSEASEAMLLLYIPNKGESLHLHKEHAKQETTLRQINLNSSEIFGYAEAEFTTARKERFSSARMAEVTLEEETTNAQYYQETTGATVTRTLNQSRYGGYASLNANASSETVVQRLMLLQNKNEQTDGSEVVFKTNNQGESIEFFSLGITSESSSSTIHLQRHSKQISNYITLVTPCIGQKQQLVTLESQWLEQHNNIQVKKEIYDYLAIERIISDKRYGGKVYLGTKHAAEEVISLEQQYTKLDRVAETSFTKHMPSTAEPLIVFCTATREDELLINYNFASLSDREADVKIILIVPNVEKILEIKVREMSEIDEVINFSIQKDRAQHSSKKTISDKLFGGRKSFFCQAATSVAQYFTANLVKQLAFEERLQTFAHSYSARAMIDCISSKQENESALWFFQNLAEQSDAVKTIFSIPLLGTAVSLTAMQTEESIFNMEVEFEKQSNQLNFTWTTIEKRAEVPQHFVTKASQLTKVELTKIEERDRLTNYNTDFIVYRASRAVTPVIFITDYAKETLIRKDEELHSDHTHRLDQTFSKFSEVVTESEQMVCAAPVRVELTQKEEIRELKEEKVEKRVSFAAEVTEKTMTMDMSMTIERREPSIIKKPMKKENRSRRHALKMNEAPNFVPVRRNSLLMAMNIGSPHNIPHFKTLQDVIKGIEKAGLEYSNLIFGIDYTKSNFYQGERTFDGRNLHSLCDNEMNPYQQVIEIVGRTLSSFDADGVIPAYGFGDEGTTDRAIFNIYDRDDPDAECNGFEEVLRIYNERTPFIRMSGPTNFVPLIEKAVQIVQEKQSYHILVIVADGQVTNEKINQKAIAAASHYPLSIIMVGVGDGPWDMMTRFDETLPKRMFDNFHFVDFHKVMFHVPNQEASFALNALMEIPDQYKAIKELGYLKHSRRG